MQNAGQGLYLNFFFLFEYEDSRFKSTFILISNQVVDNFKKILKYLSPAIALITHFWVYVIYIYAHGYLVSLFIVFILVR